MKLTQKQVEQYIKKNWEKLTVLDIAKNLSMSESSVRRRSVKLGLPKKTEMVKTFTLEEIVEKDKADIEEKNNNKDLKSKYSFLLSENKVLQKEIEAFKKKSGNLHKIPKTQASP